MCDHRARALELRKENRAASLSSLLCVRTTIMYSIYRQWNKEGPRWTRTSKILLNLSSSFFISYDLIS